MRQIDNRLERTLENLAAQLIEQDGEGNRNDCVEYQLAKGNHQRVPEDLHAVREGEDNAVVFQAHPLRTEQAEADLVVLEGHERAHQRNENKQSQDNHARQEHQVENQAFPLLTVTGAPLLHFCCRHNTLLRENGLQNMSSTALEARFLLDALACHAIISR